MTDMLSSETVNSLAPNGHALRSPESIAFEEAWEAARRNGAVPVRADLDLRLIAPFARWFAIIEPDPHSVALPFRLTGSGFREFFGTDLTGLDYLSLADPAIHTYAYQCVMACLAHPCGLWQRTPATAEDGKRLDYEYTILPISKAGGGPDHIVIFVNFEAKPVEDLPGLQRIEHSTVWHWLDIGEGVPPASIGTAPLG